MKLLKLAVLSLSLVLFGCAAACSDPTEDADVSGAVSGESKAAADGAIPSGGAMTSESNDGAAPAVREQVVTLGAGCFWCIEAVLEQIDGVLDVRSGYMGGEVEAPTYEQVCSGTTGHAEVVQVRFDANVLSFEGLLEWFWKLHDPTQIDRQGNDEGPQYRSAIFYHSEEQRRAAEESKAREDASGRHLLPIATEVTAASTFWPAEDYHQDYYRGNRRQGYCRFVIAPKLDKLGLEK